MLDRMSVRIAGAAAGLLACAYVAMHHNSLMDLDVYVLGAGSVLHHDGLLYDGVTATGYGFTYPPFAAVLLAPIAAISVDLLRLMWTASLGIGVVLLFRASARDCGFSVRVATWLALPALVLVSPLFENLRMGQASLFVALMVLLDLGSGRRGAATRGFWVGVAAGVKLTPAIFIVWLALTRQWRATANALVGFVGTVTVGLIVLPSESVAYWTHHVFSTPRIGNLAFASNQSVRGVLQRLLHGGALAAPLALVMSAVLVVTILALAVRSWRTGRVPLAVALVGIASLLTSPVSWNHHWVWCVPAGYALAGLAIERGWSRRLRLAQAAAWLSAFVVIQRGWFPRHHDAELTWTLPQTLLGDSYAIWSLLFVATVAATLWRARHDAGPALMAPAGSRGRRTAAH